MKATVDIPDQLYRQVKSRAAMEGRAVREVTIELYEQWLASASGPDHALARDKTAWLARWDELGDEIARKAVDPRTSREILLAVRREYGDARAKDPFDDWAGGIDEAPGDIDTVVYG